MVRKKERTNPSKASKAITEQLEGAEYWAERNKKAVLGSIVVIFLIVGGYFGFRYYVSTQEELAQQEMFQAVYYFEADSSLLALEGDGNNLGFSQIIEDYGMTDAANLAQYYVGVIQLKEGNFESAIDHFSNFNTDDILVQAHAHSLTGDAYMELGEYNNAVDYYRKAAAHKPNKIFTPIYLMKEALALEKLSQKDDAIAVYQKIIDQYRDSDQASQAKKFMARLHTDS